MERSPEIFEKSAPAIQGLKPNLSIEKMAEAHPLPCASILSTVTSPSWLFTIKPCSPLPLKVLFAMYSGPELPEKILIGAQTLKQPVPENSTDPIGNNHIYPTGKDGIIIVR